MELFSLKQFNNVNKVWPHYPSVEHYLKDTFCPGTVIFYRSKDSYLFCKIRDIPCDIFFDDDVVVSHAATEEIEMKHRHSTTLREKPYPYPKFLKDVSMLKVSFKAHIEPIQAIPSGSKLPRTGHFFLEFPVNLSIDYTPPPGEDGEILEIW